eukprot:TRINITY_DN205_c0_g1_i4.p1 TRINITY_DN205_c0_g1~~TRINITY_DN205_c0_g1_i4.p1  ORF type:complete len:208 (+),score=49.32 TRINITY_DN205_c0_g1_i4:234-857(+)
MAELLFKLLIIGDAEVGKSSILIRFTDDEFIEKNPPTIGVDFKLKIMKWQGRDVKLTIWDTAGQERFRTLTSSYYRGAQGIILVYDVTRRETFEHLEMWLNEVDMYTTNSNAVKILIGNKLDLVGERQRAVDKEEAQSFARAHAMMYIETSAKTKTGIQQAFDEVVQKIMDTPDLVRGGNDSNSVSLNSNESGNAGAACAGLACSLG